MLSTLALKRSMKSSDLDYRMSDGFVFDLGNRVSDTFGFDLGIRMSDTFGFDLGNKGQTPFILM